MRAVRWPTVLLFVVPATLVPQDVSAQARTPLGYVGLTTQVAQTRGLFADYEGGNWGLNASFTLPLPHVPWLGLRADLGFLRYGQTNRHVRVYSPSSRPPYAPDLSTPPDVYVDLVTSSTIAHAGIGPQLTVAVGPVQPWVTGAVQLRYFGASSALMRADSGAARIEKFGQIQTIWSAGCGATIALPPMHGARMSIDVGIRYYRDGSVRFLRTSDVVFAFYDVTEVYALPWPSNMPRPPAGSISVGSGVYVDLQPPQRLPMDLVVYHIGVRMPVP